MAREYGGLDLVQALRRGLTWRRFSVLLRGLSRDSHYYTLRVNPETRVVEDPEEIDRIEDRLLGLS